MQACQALAENTRATKLLTDILISRIRRCDQSGLLKSHRNMLNWKPLLSSASSSQHFPEAQGITPPDQQVKGRQIPLRQSDEELLADRLQQFAGHICLVADQTSL